MERFFSIPELLPLVFALLDPISNARNARVCKLWTDFALDEVWKIVHAGVFRSLVDMTPTANDPKLLVRSYCHNMREHSHPND